MVMGRLPIGLWLLLAGAVGCGRVAQRTVEEQDTTSQAGSTSQGGRGGAPGVGGSVVGGMGAVTSTAGVGGITDPGCYAPSPLPLQPLSNWEYARSVEAAIKITTTEPFPPATSYGFPFSFGIELSEVNVTALYELVETYGSLARSTLQVSCVEADLNEKCARTIIQPLVQRAFRRQRDDDVERYLALFNTGASDGGWEGGLELLAEGVLLSPAFLFKWYPGEPSMNRTARLTPTEYASRLAYFVTGAPPDAELLRAASNDDLQTDAAIEQQVRRLLEGPRFPSQARHFYSQWLGLYQLDNLVGPELSAETLKTIREPTEAFIDDVFQTDRSWRTLLIGHPEALDGAPGLSGLLTARSTLVRWNNPTQRGKFVRERLLCNPVPAPPPGVPTLPPEVGPGQTRRDVWIEHRANPACAACHQMMDPIGFGLENYDELGLYRSTDNGQPIDASGEFVNAGDADGPFVGEKELKQRLFNSRTVAECHAATWLGFGLQRSVDSTDACWVDDAYLAFADSDFDIGELLVSVVLSQQFRTRDRYMGGRGDSVPPTPALPATAVGKAERRKVVLDFAIAETQWLASIVSAEDRPILDQYLNGLRTQEIKLGNIE